MRAMKDSGIEWIGEIPQGWDVERLKYHAQFNPQTVLPDYSDEDQVTFIPMDSLKSGFHLHTVSSFGKVKKGYVSFSENDILMAKVTPCLENGNLAIATNLINGVGFGSTEINVIRCYDIKTQYLFYLLQCPSYIEKATFSMFGVAGLKRLEPEFIPNSYFPMPPQEDQIRITDYLDAKCAEIDALIAAKEKTNVLLKERRQSIIYEAVTKGLDPTVLMKDSGVEWIGEIPEGWSVAKIGFLFKTIGSGTTPTSSDGSYYDGEYNWLQTGDLNDSIIETTEKTITDSAIKNYSVLNCYSVGSLVIAMYGATIGKLGIMGVPCYTNQACCVLDDPQNADTKYVYYWLLGYRQVLINISLGGGQPNSQSIIRSFRVCLPPKNDQEAIAKELDSRVSSLDQIMKQNENTIQLLKEYRQSLIYEAVTGKIEV